MKGWEKNHGTLSLNEGPRPMRSLPFVDLRALPYLSLPVHLAFIYSLSPVKTSLGQLRGLERQFEKQNTYDEAIKKNMKAAAQEYDMPRALEEIVDAMREELPALTRAKDGPY